MKVYKNSNELVPCLLIATNQYGTLHLSIVVNRCPSKEEGIEIMKQKDYWQPDDEIEIVWGMNEPVFVIL